jgi:hypothetical protein
MTTFTQTIRQHRRWLVPAAIFITVAGVFIARTAFAKVVINTIDPVAGLSEHGRHVELTGPLQVLPAGERVVLRVTVTQRSTGASAEGETQFVATGDLQHWAVQAQTMGRQAFAPGPARATALALTVAKGGEVTDAHQWLVDITLVEE